MHNEAGEANPVICNDGGPSTTKEFHAPQVPPEMIIRSSRSRAHVNPNLQRNRKELSKSPLR
ncbi:unnamed protein product [Clonostachys rosea f. rosea IK726]|uniref:Uncharacterized protein n=1 Tax=Clonostachys rosea f. rosea IK726 TaxID=1349383 RepID=A0ACA9TC53_BIOOC|nr:unnamed protein product [Clonostachys rosea f. rosea IK726]